MRIVTAPLKQAAATGRSVLLEDVMSLKEETYQKYINEKLGIE